MTLPDFKNKLSGEVNEPMMERLLTAKETAKLWSCCTETVLRKIRRGEIEVVYIANRAPRIRESTIAKYVREHVRGGADSR